MSRKPTEGAVLHPVWCRVKGNKWEHTDGHSIDKTIQIRMAAVMKKVTLEKNRSLLTTEPGDCEVETTSSSTTQPMTLTDQNSFSPLMSSDGTLLSLWDMGGHRSFQASHNIFISSHGVYLLVFRLTDFLRDKVETDRLKKWIRLIGTFSSDGLNTKDLSKQKILAPPLIFVGTFLDELKKISKDYNKQIEIISRSIMKFPELSRLHFVKFCTVDNSLGNDDTELETLRKFITEAAEHQDQWEREIPTAWLKFELNLFEARERGKRILKLADVIKMNRFLMDGEETKLALEYLHCTRSLIYFREFDYVVNDPQWLADFFSILITDDQFLPKDDLLLNRDLELYKTKGELTEKLIESLLRMEKNKAFAPFKSLLLALMEKFGLIVKIIVSKSDAEAAQFSEAYTIPSKLMELQEYHINELNDDIKSLKIRKLAVSKTLCLVFGDVYVPYELFHRIFARVLRTYRTSSLSPRNFAEAAEGSQSPTKNTDCLYMDFGCFEVDDLCRIILSMHAERSTIAVTVFSPTESKLPADSGKRVRRSIEHILQETLQMSNQQHFRYSWQLHCNFYLSSYDTPVKLYGINHGENGVPCKGGKCQGQHRLSKVDAEYWDVTEDAKTQRRDSTAETTLVRTNIPERRPTPQELGRLSRLCLGTSCEIMFVELGISWAEINETKKAFASHAPMTQTTKLLIKWTNMYPNQTFHDIKHAMENVGMATDRIYDVIETNEKSSARGIVSNAVWIRVPSDDEIKQIVDHIDSAFFNLFLELGLSPPVIDQNVLCHSNFKERMVALLQCWMDTFKHQATIGRLLTAMKVCQMDFHTMAEILSTCQETL